MRYLEIDAEKEKFVKTISKFRRTRAFVEAGGSGAARGSASRGRASLDSADSDGLPR